MPGESISCNSTLDRKRIGEGKKMAEYKIRAGAGKAEIRFVEEDFPLKAFTGIHDGIFVRVLILEENIRMALISVELTSLPAEAVRQFQKVCSRETGIEEERIFVSVTHTFSAPHIPPCIRNEQEQRLSDTMYERICGAVCRASRDAKESVRPTVLEYKEASCCLNVNRNIDTPEGFWIGRNEEAFSDHTVRVLKFRQENQTAAYVVNYDVQASVMDRSESAAGGRLISGDLAGAAMKCLEEKSKAVAIFLPGCAGDQAPVLQAVHTAADGTVRDLHENGFVLAEQLGQYLAERVNAAKELPKDGSAGFLDTGLCIVSRTAELPEQEMKYPTKELRPKRQYSFELTGQSIPAQITLVRMGGIQMLLTAPELNSGFGRKIRQILGDRLVIGTLVNGGLKYLPEAEDFERITYEAMNTKLGPGSAEQFLETAAALKKEGAGSEDEN